MSWHTVHECSTSEARLVCGFLDNDVIVTRIVDATGTVVSRETLDSAISPVTIGVRAADVSAAMQNLADMNPNSKGVRHDESLERLGSTLRACAMSPFPFAPWGVVLAPRYLARAMHSVDKPREHAWNLAAIVLCGSMTVIFAGLAVTTVLS